MVEVWFRSLFPFVFLQRPYRQVLFASVFGTYRIVVRRGDLNDDPVFEIAIDLGRLDLRDGRGVSGTLPRLRVFLLFFSLSLASTHILLSRPSRPYLFLFFIPLPHACAYSIRPARRVSPFSFIPSHVIDHLTAMCQPHGSVVTDRDCFQPIVAFVGFLVCPLLETKHGLCAVRF
jgi:hypothetical protein